LVMIYVCLSVNQLIYQLTAYAYSIVYMFTGSVYTGC